MKCIVLAAGYATRLYPLTENFPKPLLAVGDSTILDRLLDDLGQKAGIRDFYVVTNGRFEKIFREWACNAQHRPDCTVHVVSDGTMTNETRIGAVRDMRLGYEAAMEMSQGEETDDGYIVMAGDNVLDFSLEGFAAFGRKKKAPCVMCYREPDMVRRRKTAIISLDGERRITEYAEKPAEPASDLAVPPFYYYRAADLGRIPEALENGCGADAPGSFAAWLSRRTAIYGYAMPGCRYDVGDIRGYEEVKRIFAQV